MDIGVKAVGIHVDHQSGKREFMYHGMTLISIFYGFGDDVVFQVPAIDKIVFIGPVSPADDRLPDESRDLDVLFFILHLQKIQGYISAVNVIDHVFQVSVPGG
jgi:hypothetical protein